MKVFVMHYSKLVDRKKHILEQFEKQNITDFEFIENYDKDEITDSERSLFDTNYNKSKMSLHLKHNYVYKIISDKYENALIFEDDIVLCENFIETLNKYMTQLPDNYDMLFIGDGCNLHIENHRLIPNQNVYEKCVWEGDGAIKCTDSYIISRNCATKICEYIDNLKTKINLPVDWWLNVAARDNLFKIYWVEPTIVTQGSQNGLFETSL